MESWKYANGSVLRDYEVQNDKDCLNECNANDNCMFWDFHEGKCRILSDEGNGPISGYEGAVSGKKNCRKIKSGLESMKSSNYVI